MNFSVFLKGVDVVEDKEWISCEHANAIAIFSADDMKSAELVCIPVKPLFKTGREEPMTENLPNIQHKGDFGQNNIIFSQAEAVKIPNATCGRYSTKHLATLQSSLANLSRGGWYVDYFVGRVTAIRHRDVDNCSVLGLMRVSCSAVYCNVTWLETKSTEWKAPMKTASAINLNTQQKWIAWNQLILLFPGFEVVTCSCYDLQFPYDHQHLKNWEYQGSRNWPTKNV